MKGFAEALYGSRKSHLRTSHTEMLSKIEPRVLNPDLPYVHGLFAKEDISQHDWIEYTGIIKTEADYQADRDEEETEKFELFPRRYYIWQVPRTELYVCGFRSKGSLTSTCPL